MEAAAVKKERMGSVVDMIRPPLVNMVVVVGG